jgi:hypothetical protein
MRVFETQVRGTGFLWIAPQEGVYHWRLAKADKKGLGGEVVSTVSGSFVALDPEISRPKAARISWAAVKGSDQYKIFMFDQSGRTRISTTTSTSLIVPQGGGLTMIEVVPQKGTVSLQRSYHFLPSLFFSSGRPLQPPPPPPPPVSQAPVAGGLSSPEGIPPNPDLPLPPLVPVPPRERLLQEVALDGIYLRETLSLNKLDLTLENQFTTGGGVLRVWASPIPGFVLSLEGSGWKLAGKLPRLASQVTDGGLNLEPELSSTRFLLHGGVGFDFLSFLDINEGSLSLSLIGGGTSQPFLPTAYEIPTRSTPFPEAPKIKDQVMTLGGGKFSFFWGGSSVGIWLEALHLVHATEKHQVSSGSLVGEFYPRPMLALQAGVMGQRGQWEICEDDTARCLAEGKVSTTSEAVGGMVGAAFVFK